jgi:hypothetical protein
LEGEGQAMEEWPVGSVEAEPTKQGPTGFEPHQQDGHREELPVVSTQAVTSRRKVLST